MKTTSDKQSNWSPRNRHGAAMLVIALGALAFANFATAATWDGENEESDNWSVSSNWVGDEAPASPTTDTITFTATDAGNINIVDTSRQVGGLYYGATHTTDLGGNTLTVAGNISISSGSPTIRNGTLSLGSAESRRSITVMTGDWGNPALTLSSGTTLNAYLNGISVGIYRNGSGTLDLSAATVNCDGVANTLQVTGNINIGTGESSGGTVLLPTSLESISTTGDLLIGSGSLGFTTSGSLLSSIVVGRNFQARTSGILNIPSGVSMSVGSVGTRGYFRLGGRDWDSDGVTFTLPGGSLTGYLTDVTLTQNYNQGAITLDLSTAASVNLDITGAITVNNSTIIKLPTGTVSTGTMAIGATGTSELAGTTFSFTNTGASAVSNAGTIKGYGTVSGAGTFTSTGYVRAETGTLDLTGLTGTVSISRLYAQNSGTLALPDAAMSVTTLDAGSTGGGTVNLNGTDISMGANSVTVASSGALTGYGSISGATLTMNGTVLASGGTLDLSGFTTVASSTGSGWFVENGGAITLPARNVTANDSFTWGELATSVNSIQLDFTNVTGGDLSISVLDPDTVAFLPEGTTGDILSLWEIDGSSFTFGAGNVNLVFRYDDSRLGGLDESLLKVFHYNGSAWEQLTTEIDTGANTASVTGVSSFSPFAVGFNISGGIIPEPASLALLGLGAAWLLNRRRRA
jgi:fibronectin-binding autotransporter adhesin